jgi:hypothetical protein
MPNSAARFEAVPVLAAWDETPALRSIRVDLGPLRPDHVLAGQVVKVRAPSGEAYFALACSSSGEAGSPTRWWPPRSRGHASR